MSVLISIRPEWCEKIASGEKTIKVRKSAPKEVPFKAYIYCTNDRKIILDRSETGKIFLNVNIYRNIPMGLNGKVIGEFICDKVYEWKYDYCDGVDIDDDLIIETCLDREDINIYAKGKTLYGWHISDLKIYGKPKELREFSPICSYKNDDGSCQYRKVDCPYQQRDYNTDGSVNLVTCGKPITRPPQSYMYVDEVEE